MYTQSALERERERGEREWESDISAALVHDQNLVCVCEKE